MYFVYFYVFMYCADFCTSKFALNQCKDKKISSESLEFLFQNTNIKK